MSHWDRRGSDDIVRSKDATCTRSYDNMVHHSSSSSSFVLAPERRRLDDVPKVHMCFESNFDVIRQRF